MKLAHLSDTHLGFRAYSRTTSDGLNQRESDVQATFRAALDAILERDPDVVVHSGDLFHVVRPSNHTITATFRALQRFQSARGGRPFVLVGGNHDTPRTADTGNLLTLFEAIEGVRVFESDRATDAIAELDLELLCVPSHALHRPGAPGHEWTPTQRRRHSLLVVHGMAAQALPDHADFDVAEARVERWTYVALGDYHIRQQYAPNCCYPGSTDFTSTNIWEEVREPKGWAWFDASLGMLEFVPLATRDVLDLEPLDAVGLTGHDITEAAVAAAVWDSGSMPIVRQVVSNVHPDVRRHVDSRAVREIQARALHYRLDLRTLQSDGALQTAGEGVTLEDEWVRHVERADLARGVEKPRVASCGVELLRRVEVETDSS